MLLKRYRVPTGDILIIEGDRGKPLELLSIGDYGKERNIKADFMGLTKPIHGIEHCSLLPLEEKWVVTISSQYGCSSGCVFCDVPKVGKGINATRNDMLTQLEYALELHPEVRTTKRLNLHFARMGEPTWNWDVIDAAKTMRHWLYEGRGWGFHPVVSTMMPRRNRNLAQFISSWLELKSEFEGEAGLQLSINTTDEEVRRRDFADSALPLESISEIMSKAPKVVGRKIALNFALTGAAIDADALSSLFSPDRFMCKLTPMHASSGAVSSGLVHLRAYHEFQPYQETEKALKRAGFDVIVFVPSVEEDRSRITCGNAILSGTEPG